MRNLAFFLCAALLLFFSKQLFAQEMPLIEGSFAGIEKGIYIYTKDGGLYVQNRRGSPIPAVLLVTRFETREEWEDAGSIFAWRMDDLPASTLMMTSNGATLFSELLLEADNEALLIPPEQAHGYFRIAAAWGGYSASLHDNVPLQLDWLSGIKEQGETLKWTVEKTLMLASTVAATSGALVTAASNIKGGVGTSVSLLQDIIANSNDLWDVIERIDDGPHGSFKIFELADGFLSNVFGDTFSSATISKARMAAEWLTPIGPSKIRFYTNCLAVNSVTDGLVVASDLIISRDKMQEVSIYLDSQGNINSEAIIPRMSVTEQLAGDQIQLNLSADETFVYPNVTGLQYTWAVNLIPDSGPGQNLYFDGPNVSTAVSGGQEALVVLSVSGYKDGVFFAPRPIKSRFRIPLLVGAFDSEIVPQQLSGGRTVNIDLLFTDIDASDLRELNIDFGDGMQETFFSDGEAIPDNFLHEYASDGSYAIKVGFLTLDGGLGYVTKTAEVGYDDNQCPVAELSANPTQVSVGTTVSIAGSGSNDPDNDAISFHWSLQGPGGSSALLVGTGSSVELTPDVGGVYTVKLAVSDQSCTSSQVSVAINADASETYFEPEAWTSTNIGISSNKCGKVIQLGSHTLEQYTYWDNPRLWASTFAPPDGGRYDLYLMMGLNSLPSAESDAAESCADFGLVDEGFFDYDFVMNMADGTLTSEGGLTHVKTWGKTISPGDTVYIAAGVPDNYPYDIENVALQTNHRYQPPVAASCGTAAGTLVAEAPTNGRCASGSNATGVTTHSDRFTWSCASSTGGATANCQAPRGYHVSPTAEANGTLSPSSPQIVAYNEQLDLSVNPYQGYKASINGCGISRSNIYGTTTVTTSPITSDCSVVGSFSEISPAVCGSSAGLLGTSAPTSNLCAADSTASPVSTFPSRFTWTCNSDLGGRSASCEAPRAYTITASVGPNGSMTPNTPRNLEYGQTQEFEVSYDEAYSATVTGCAGSFDDTARQQSGYLEPARYMTGPITDNCMITANFVETGECATGPVMISGANFAAGTYSFASEQSIVTEGSVVLEEGADVALEAPSIAFGPGLKVTTGALLRAEIGPISCDSPALAHQVASRLAAPEASATTGSGGWASVAPRLLFDASQLPDWIQSLLAKLGVDLQRAEDILADNDYLWLVFATNQGILSTDQNGYRDVYRLDLFSETITLLSRTPRGTAGNGPSRYPAADASGELVVFQSDADDLVAGDTNGVTDIFLHDVPFGETIRVTAAAVAASEHPALDAAGEDLLYDQRDADGQRQVLLDGLWDGGVAESVSLIEDGAGLLLDNHHPAISADGRYVAYLEARADGLEPTCQVHVYDRDTALYRRTPCPEELAAEPEGGRAHFSADDSELWWNLSGMEAPVIVPNPLIDGQAVATP